MKTAFLVLILFPLLSQAQDTCKLKKETDAFTHQTRISTGFVPFVSSGNQLSVSVDATSTDIDIFLWLKNDGKCFDDQSSVQVNFEGDRSKGNFKNSGSMNCEGAFHFTFRNTPSTPGSLQRMTTTRIASLKITGSNKTITDISFNEEQKKQLLRMISCVVTQGKTLIKQ